MLYLYNCPKCKSKETVEKSMKDSARAELCPKCKSLMIRNYGGQSVITADGLKT